MLTFKRASALRRELTAARHIPPTALTFRSMSSGLLPVTTSRYSAGRRELRER